MIKKRIIPILQYKNNLAIKNKTIQHSKKFRKFTSIRKSL